MYWFWSSFCGFSLLLPCLDLYPGSSDEFSGMWAPKGFVCCDWFGARAELLRSLSQWCVSSDPEVNNNQEGVWWDVLLVWKETIAPNQPQSRCWCPSLPPLHKQTLPKGQWWAQNPAGTPLLQPSLGVLRKLTTCATHTVNCATHTVNWEQTDGNLGDVRLSRGCLGSSWGSKPGVWALTSDVFSCTCWQKTPWAVLTLLHPAHSLLIAECCCHWKWSEYNSALVENTALEKKKPPPGIEELRFLC